MLSINAHRISTRFTPSSSANVIEAQLEDIVGTMEQVKDSLMMEAARKELGELKVSALQKRAREVGVDEEAVAEAVDTSNPKEGLISLILAGSASAR